MNVVFWIFFLFFFNSKTPALLGTRHFNVLKLIINDKDNSRIYGRLKCRINLIDSYVE